MAIAVHVVLPGVTKEQCNQVRDAVGRLGEQRLGPGRAKAGVAVKPQVTFNPAHEVFTPQSVKLTS
jgi:hypothetical protein